VIYFKVTVNQMQLCRITLLLALLPIFAVWFTPSARAESYAPVCATIVDAESNETPLAEISAPGAGEKLVVHMGCEQQY
jgi:hypothetical protein